MNLGLPSWVRQRWLKLSAAVLISLLSTGCIGTVVGAVVDTTIEVIKVPFIVGGAVIDAVTPDDYSQQEHWVEEQGVETQEDREAAAIHMEQEGI